MIYGYSINAITVTNVNSQSTFVAVPPNLGVKSSAPVNGTFTVTCTNKQGQIFTSKEIGFNSQASSIESAISQSIPFLTD